MFTAVGNCPKCGAPIYVESPWHGITPPPTKYSCGCFRDTMKIITNPTTGGT